MSLSRNLFRIAATAVVAAALSSAQPMWSQVQSINGTIRGTVTDAAGAPVADATVTITNTDTGYVRELHTDSSGAYLAPNLPIGTYSVAASSTSFAPLKQTGIHVSAGSDLTIDESLKPGSVATEVQVTSDAPIIEATRTDLGRTIGEAETQNLPLTSRNPYNFILFQPGVSGHPNPENGIPRTVNTNGLVDRVQYQLDGMVDTETDRYGLRLFAISDSYVKEVQTISNSFPPEFGNTAGIIYNVITPSGTNSLHGSVQYIWRPKAASSCPILQNCNTAVTGGKPKPDLHVDDYVARAGGPIIKDKLFFFGAYEKLKRANPQAVTIAPTTQAALIANGVSPSDFNTAPQVQRAQWVNGRVDWTINNKNLFFVRYNYFRNDYPFNTNVGGNFAQSASSDFRDRAHIIGAQLITTFSPYLINEFRGSWPYRNQHHFASNITGPGPMITIAGTTPANFGGTNGAGDKFQEKIPSFSDNVTWVKGKHSFKFGVGFQKNLDTQLADIYTQYTFPTIQAWVDAKNNANNPASTAPLQYSTLKASIGNPGAAYHSIFFDFFVQDSWQITPKLIATYGVRYDQYRAPNGQPNAPLVETHSFRTPAANFAPRVGFAYTAFPGTVVRLNAGLFYEATPTNSWYNPLYSNGDKSSPNLIATVPGGQSGTCAIRFPNTISAGIDPSCLSALTPTALNPNFKNEYTWNVNVQVAQQLAKNDSLTLGYTMTNGRNMQFLRNSNLINPVGNLADGRPVYSSAICAGGSGDPSTCPSDHRRTRVNTAYNAINYIDTGANTSYNAFVATYEHRLSAGLTTSVSYTWSHSLSDTPEGNSYEFSNAIADPSNRKFDRGNSSINRPNALTISAVYQPDTHFENKYVNGLVRNNNFAFLLNASSGDPQNITTSAVLNNDPLATQRPLFTRRNTLVTPAIYQADLRYTRTLLTLWERVHPSIFIEANNLLNRSNVTSINAGASVTPLTYNTPTDQLSGVNPSSGTITTPPTRTNASSVLEARILQFGAKITF